MRSLVSTLTLALVTAVLASPIANGAQPEQSRLTGRVTDGSGAALPGATVTITGPGSSKPVVVVTDEVGQYQTPPIQPGTYGVTFEMSGFETRTSPTILLGPGEVFVLDRQLGLASLTETVTVTGEAPKPPLPPAAPLPPLRSRPQAVPVPRAMLASVCGPDKPADISYTVGHIAAHRDDPKRELYGPGDVLLVDVGGDTGLTAGQNFVVRRRFRYGDKSAPLKYATFGEHTAGLVQVVETTPDTSVVVVVYACGEFMAGDALEPFDPLPVVTARSEGSPRFDDPARIVFGEMGRVTSGPNQLMVIDRGFNQGVTRGQRLTIFRRSLGESGPATAVGDAVVIVTRPQSATIRIERVTDVVEVGDQVALHR